MKVLVIFKRDKGIKVLLSVSWLFSFEAPRNEGMDRESDGCDCWGMCFEFERDRYREGSKFV